MNRPLSVSIDNEVNVPSVSIAELRRGRPGDRAAHRVTDQGDVDVDGIPGRDPGGETRRRQALSIAERRSGHSFGAPVRPGEHDVGSGDARRGERAEQVLVGEDVSVEESGPPQVGDRAGADTFDDDGDHVVRCGLHRGAGSAGSTIDVRPTSAAAEIAIRRRFEVMRSGRGRCCCGCRRNASGCCR